MRSKAMGGPWKKNTIFFNGNWVPYYRMKGEWCLKKEGTHKYVILLF